MAEVKLYQKETTYKDTKTGEEKTATRFYLALGNVNVPVQIAFFPDKDTGKDSQYNTRKTLMKAFAENFPERM